MEKHFEKLEELIKDDNKIVTVVSFAVSANISVEESEKVLGKYVEAKKKSKEIYTTYVLNGVKRDTGKLLVVQVDGEALSHEKELYEDDPAVCVFSIQKTKQIDYNVISLVEPDLNMKEKSLETIIVGKNCIQRVLRKNVLPSLPAATIRGKSSIFLKQSSSAKSEKTSEENVKVQDKIEADHKANETRGNMQGSISSMFNKAAQAKQTNREPEKSAEKKPKQNGGLSNFFKKCPSKEVNEIKKESAVKIVEKNVESTSDTKLTDKTNVKKENKKSELFDSDTDEEVLKDLSIQEENRKDIKKENSIEVKPNQKKNKSSQKKKRGMSDVGNEKSTKKRRRIIVEDSDSDDIFGSEKSDHEDIIETSDKEPDVKVETKPLPSKTRRRKAVKKTFEDDEGFIVTQTEYLYETASEDENVHENKTVKKVEESKPVLKKKNSNSETEISPNKAVKNKKGIKKVPSGNQPTLMNFFKKK